MLTVIDYFSSSLSGELPLLLQQARKCEEVQNGKYQTYRLLQMYSEESLQNTIL
jgi:hypothetical protein